MVETHGDMTEQSAELEHEPGREEREKFDQQVLHNITRERLPEVDEAAKQVYTDALCTLNGAQIPYVVGAAFARYAYTHVWRWTKDLDLFLRAHDLQQALQALERSGFRTEVEFEHWLAKAFKGDEFVDLIFGTGHGQLRIDDGWLARSQPGELWGIPVRISSIEDIIASACYIAERNRFDASDIVHLILTTGGRIDWQLLLDLLGGNKELLLWHLLFFDFCYPGRSDYLPQELMEQLFDEIRARWSHPPANPKSFRGMILDPFSFTVDVQDWGYEDRRDLTPLVDERGEAL